MSEQQFPAKVSQFIETWFGDADFRQKSREAISEDETLSERLRSAGEHLKKVAEADELDQNAIQSAYKGFLSALRRLDSEKQIFKISDRGRARYTTNANAADELALRNQLKEMGDIPGLLRTPESIIQLMLKSKESRANVNSKAKVDNREKNRQGRTPPKEGDDGVRELFDQIKGKKPEDLASSDLTAAELREMSDLMHSAAMKATESELDGNEPTAVGANWYFKQFKEPELNDQIRVELADKGKHIREHGITILFDDQPCTLGTVFVKASGKKCFRVRETGASSKKLCSQYTIPDPLNFF